MSRILTVLRYPGGKSKYIKKYLEPYLFKNFNRFVDPFVGGGSYPLYILKEYPNREVWINDFNLNVYSFWKALQNDYQKLYEEALSIKQNNNEETGFDLFSKFSKEINDLAKDDYYRRGLYFYVMNRTSFSGLTEKGYFTPRAWQISFTPSIISNLLKAGPLLKHTRITNLDYKDIFKEVVESDYVFLDPPYDIKHFLYGKDGKFHKGFDHLKFKNQVDTLKGKFLITYNNNDTLCEYYKNYNIDFVDYKYSMALTKGSGSANKETKELMIYNYELENVLNESSLAETNFGVKNGRK
mgnify:CR=1 FL=1